MEEVNNTMKKAFACTLSLALLLSLTACNTQTDQPNNSVVTSTQADVNTTELDNTLKPEPSKTPALETLSDITSTAADMSGLGAKDAQAFLDVLSERAKNNLIAYADLKDMDGDGTAELVAVDENGKVNIWQAKNGNAVQVADATFPAGTMDYMMYCTKEGKTYIRVNYDHGRWGILDVKISFITVGGIYESLSFHSELDGSGFDNIEEYSRTIDGKTVSITETQFVQFDAAYKLIDDMYLEGAGQSWIWEGRDEGRHHESYQTVIKLLLAKASATPATGTYGPYTINGTDYRITFSAAVVEEKTIQCVYLSGSALDPDRESSERHTVITLQPGSFISISGGNAPDIYHNGRYVIGTAGYIKNGSYYFGIGETYLTTGIAGDSFSSSDAVCKLEDGSIIAALSTDFTDIELGAYYSDAVKWAVDHKIASGTTTTTFSPDQTCTVAQILSFIWRANGSPEPTAANPFTDIKTSDYYYKAALWAVEKGLVTGNKLNPDTPCTRAMTMEYLWKAAGRPTVQSEDYKPFTITEEAWDGSTCVITFDAASVKQSTVRLCEDYFGSVGEIEHDERDETGMLITVPSGSRVKIDNPSGADFPWGADGVDMKWYYSDNAGVFHSDPGVSSDAFSSGDVIKDNAIARFYTNGYLLTASSAPPAFADVPANAEYAQAVTWAVENGITSGTGNGQFSPDTTCTRGQIMTFLYRAMGK